MKKPYIKPKMEWISIRPRQPVAAPCWSYAGKGPLYHDVPGTGYVEIMLSKGGCGKATIVSVKLSNADHMTSQEIAATEAWFYEHLAQKMAEAGNNMASFKGNGFETSPDPEWS